MAGLTGLPLFTESPMLIRRSNCSSSMTPIRPARPHGASASDMARGVICGIVSFSGRDKLEVVALPTSLHRAAERWRTRAARRIRRKTERADSYQVIWLLMSAQ
jgi:hypothetical protein